MVVHQAKRWHTRVTQGWMARTSMQLLHAQSACQNRNTTRRWVLHVPYSKAHKQGVRSDCVTTPVLGDAPPAAASCGPSQPPAPPGPHGPRQQRAQSPQCGCREPTRSPQRGPVMGFEGNGDCWIGARGTVPRKGHRHDEGVEGVREVRGAHAGAQDLCNLPYCDSCEYRELQ